MPRSFVLDPISDSISGLSTDHFTKEGHYLNEHLYIICRRNGRKSSKCVLLRLHHGNPGPSTFLVPVARAIYHGSEGMIASVPAPPPSNASVKSVLRHSCQGWWARFGSLPLSSRAPPHQGPIQGSSLWRPSPQGMPHAARGPQSVYLFRRSLKYV